MNDLLKLIGDEYLPEKALLIYRSRSEWRYYIESFDMDEQGCPINAHPLSIKESNALAAALESSEELKQNYLISKGLLPDNVLHINSGKNGQVVWFSPSMKTNLFFTEDLTIPDGAANVPALLWQASKTELHLWALAADKKPTLSTSLYQAPFFNIGTNGAVCMGNVEIRLDANCFLEEFIEKWQSYFFNSKFSHLIRDTSPVKQNIVQLWRKLVGTDKAFPTKSLKKTTLTLKSILS